MGKVGVRTILREAVRNIDRDDAMDLESSQSFFDDRIFHDALLIAAGKFIEQYRTGRSSLDSTENVE